MDKNQDILKFKNKPHFKRFMKTMHAEAVWEGGVPVSTDAHLLWDIYGKGTGIRLTTVSASKPPTIAIVPLNVSA